MDLVLEVCDTFFFDKVYATLLPKAYQASIPETPEFIHNLLGSLNETTTAAISYAESNYPALHKFAVGSKEIYGYNAEYHFYPETIYTNMSLLPRYNILRQVISLLLVTSTFGWLLYFLVAWASYTWVYDKSNFNHPRYLKNQVAMEIKLASSAIPVMVFLTIPWFILELHGYSKLYWDINESTGGWKALVYQIPCFILFTDCGIYFLHRWLHWPAVYKALHKPHHKWIVCTPFASHAFHPVDGYFQSLPYHVYPFFFPLHKVSYLLLFTFVNFWTVMIHDGEYLSRDPVVNGAACHTIHHLYFNYNYGQFTTLWDRLGGSYRKPDAELFDKNKRVDKKTWAKQAKLMDEIRRDVEGDNDDREYVKADSKKTQ
jgi:lathosterol oxidase